MYKISRPTGKLLVAKRVIPVCDKVVDFNGKRRRLSEIAESLDSNPTGLILYIEELTTHVFQSNGIYIGNLKSTDVQDIMKSLLTEGYYDFSNWNYQTAKDVAKLVFDDGASLPFTSEITCSAYPMLLDCFCGGGEFSDPFRSGGTNIDEIGIDNDVFAGDDEDSGEDSGEDSDEDSDEEYFD